MSRTKNAARRGRGGNSNGKRKRDDADETSSNPNKKVATADDVATKEEVTVRTEQTTCDEEIATATPEDLATRFTTAIKKCKGDLSTIELEDQSIPAKAFRSTTDFEEIRIVKNITQFLENNVEGGAEELQTCTNIASPHTLVISPSAIRTQDVLREIRKYGSEESKVAKLFAKHMKLKVMIKYVGKTKFGIGGGTPSRMKDLIENDALKLDDLKRIVIDASYVDDKQRTIFSDHDVFPQLLSLLNLELIKLRLVAGKTEILVF